ncbi:hypothetical protein GCM10015536_39870 [Streptomyces griseomycini]|nr:hypothetical protein GCM10015536_39870 [Streptomyces griseomycini]
MVYACEILAELRRRRHLARTFRTGKTEAGLTCTKTETAAGNEPPPQGPGAVWTSPVSSPWNGS